MRLLLTTSFILMGLLSFCQDSLFLKVHFLYGSKPGRGFKQTEYPWFGGIHGGHVGIETDSGKILNFLPHGEFHIITHRKKRHSLFDVFTPEQFYSMFTRDSVRYAIFVIPISIRQKNTLDSLYTAYRNKTPYDYAFWGMRCGAAAYDILARLDIVKQYKYRKTYRKIFYPRRLRKRLFKLAVENNWEVATGEGSYKRKWERD